MENQRIRLSKMLLKEALITLLGRKSIEKITVSELCEQANINRTTFYKYYGSQYELLSDIERELFEELDSHLLAAGHSSFDNLISVLEFISEGRARWRILINSVDDRDFTEKLFSLRAIRLLLSNTLSGLFEPRQMDYVYIYLCHGHYAIIREWLNADDPEPPEEIAEIIARLSMTALN